jgi:SAM-dependent methyltransferase
MSTDDEWEKWGARDPYFAVLTDPKYRTAVLNDSVVDEFFESGRLHVDYVISRCAAILGGPFRPARVLDFGCGVGRVTIPMAKIAERVVGLDVSVSMLREAHSNAQRFGIENIELGSSDDDLSKAEGEFDLVHSTIVLQHIPADRGRILFGKLVERIRIGGCGAIQLTYGWKRFPTTLGQPPAVEARASGPLDRARQLFRSHRNGCASAASESGRPVASVDPEMEMNAYSLSELAFLLQAAGVARFEADFTDHGGALGVMLYFQKT